MPAKVTQAQVDVLVSWPVKRVLWYANNSNDSRLRAIRYHIEDLGYVIKEMNGDDNLATEGFIPAYDIAIGWVLDYTRGAEFRATCEAASVPYLLFFFGGAASGQTNSPADALLTGTTGRIIPGAVDSYGNVVDNSHPITAEMSLGTFVLANNDFTAFSGIGFVDSGESFVGTPLIEGDALNSRAGYTNLIVVPAGTDDLDAPPVPTTVNAVVWGAPYFQIGDWTQDAKDILTRSLLWLTGDLIAPPAMPTITATVISQTQVNLAGTAFLSGQGGPHIATQWQVTAFADTGYATPAYDSGEGSGPVTAMPVYNLDAGVQYRARVRYLEQQTEGDVWSNWSADDTFTMDVAPDQPTIALNSTAPDRASYDSSTFSSSDLDRIHDASRWQLTLAADTGFATPLEDVTVTFGDLEYFNFAGLNLWVNQYIARVRHQDDKGGWSPWSAATSATGLVTDGQFYTAFAERPIGIDLADDIPADWDEMVDLDQSTWPLEFRADATCEVVSHRSSEDGDADTADPIFWQGFPQVGEQIVWTRLMFTEQGGGGYPCGSGVQSPTGLICRTNYGLLQTADFENDLFDGPGERATVGEGGEPGIRFAAAPGPGWSGNPPGIGTEAIRFVGNLEWLTAGNRVVGEFTQVRARTMLTDEGWEAILEDQSYAFLAAWPELTINGVTGRTVRYCTLFLNWFRNQLLGLGTITGTVQEWGVSRGNWYYLKTGYNDAGNGWYSYSAGNREGRGTIIRGLGADAGAVIISAERCEQYDPGWQVVDFYEWTICSANVVAFTGLPDGWYVRVVSDSHGAVGQVDGGTDPVYYDFLNHAWPADRLLLYNPSRELVESWDVPTGIWGGDEYNINAGGLGVGPIGGAAVRLGP